MIDPNWRDELVHKSHPLYILGAAVTALVMIILPVIYLALMVASLGLVVLVGSLTFPLIPTARRLDGIILMVLAPLVPFVLFLFMAKPLFSRPRRTTGEIPLSSETHPELFALVRELAALIKAPEPVAVYLTHDINASAAIKPGMGNFFARNLELRIGYPLLMGLSKAELTGVLAHELGHFAQGLGMRLSFIINSVNLWFIQVVYQRDDWDDKIKELSSGRGVFALLGWLCRGMVGFGRLILRLLMIIGQGISAFFSRQKEFDADFWMGLLVGAEGQRSTFSKLRALGQGLNVAMSSLSPLFQNETRPKNLYPLWSAQSQAFMGDTEAYAQESAKAKSGLFDSHPTDEMRYRRLQKTFPSGGKLQDTAPASDLVPQDSQTEVKLTVAFFDQISPGLAYRFQPVDIAVEPASAPVAMEAGGS